MITVGYFIAIGFLVLPAMDYFLGLRVLPNYKSTGEKDVVSAVGGEGVSVIIACNNEEENIEKKVPNQILFDTTRIMKAYPTLADGNLSNIG